MLACLAFFCLFSSPAQADTSSVVTQDLSNGTITAPFGGCPSGTTPAQVNTSNWGTQTVRFGECINTFAISVAINQALSLSGISVDKAHYSWRYVHCFNTPGESCNTNISNRVNTSTGEITDDTYWDELSVVVTITDDEGNVKQTRTWTMDKWYQWNAANSHSTNEVTQGSVRWQVHEDFFELFDHSAMSGTIYAPSDLGNMSFTITGQDKGNWDGYYGPVIGNLQTHFTYRTNPCTDNTLYDPSCPGYATAYAQQQYNLNCAANPLYDSGCPGYATAYYNQQCSANALYDAGCPGYAEAYFNQQCEADPLYNSSCPGYETAYLEQQCTADPLYDSSCSGYDAAYLAQQCSISALYDSTCNGYAEAFFTQQCSLDGLYNVACPNYETAYIEKQCKLDATYLPSCAGYAEAIIEDDAIDDDGIDSVEDIVDDMNEIVDADTIGDVEITGDAVVDSVINDEPVYEVVEVIQLPVVIDTETERETVPVEIAVESAFDELPTIENFNTFVDTGPVIAPLASISAVEQVEEVKEAEILIENIETQIEMEIAQVNEPVESEVVIELETTEEKEETIEVAMIDESTDDDTSNNQLEVEEAKEEDNEPETLEETTEEETTEEAVEEETTEEENTEEAVEEETTEEENTEEEAKEEEAEEESKEENTETVVAEAKPKVKKMSKKEKAEAKKKKMKEIIKEKLKSLASDMAKANSLAEQQAIQAQINALINFVPGFNDYANVKIPGVPFYGSEEIYKNVRVAENKRGLLNGLASQLLHEQMVDMQYK